MIITRMQEHLAELGERVAKLEADAAAGKAKATKAVKAKSESSVAGDAHEPNRQSEE